MADPTTDGDPILLCKIRDRIATLTLNRPKQRNSLSVDLMSTMERTLDDIAKNRNVSVVILAANGPAFCAGHDLKELKANNSPDFSRALFRQCSRLMQKIVHLPQPVIARVHAMATAAGCQLVASADLAIASKEAQFATPGVNIGLFCSTPMVALSRNITRKQAINMLLTGDAIDAQTAAVYGLINRAVPADQLDTEIAALAEKIAGKSPLTLKIGKEAFYRQLDMPLSEAYEYASDVMARNMEIHDADEGISAFLEKRKPCWQGE